MVLPTSVFTVLLMLFKALDADKIAEYHKALVDYLCREEAEVSRLEYELNEHKLITAEIRRQLEVCRDRRVELVKEKINTMQSGK